MHGIVACLNSRSCWRNKHRCFLNFKTKVDYEYSVCTCSIFLSFIEAIQVSLKQYTIINMSPLKQPKSFQEICQLSVKDLLIDTLMELDGEGIRSRQIDCCKTKKKFITFEKVAVYSVAKWIRHSTSRQILASLAKSAWITHREFSALGNISWAF